MISAVKKCQICGKPAHLFLTQVVNSEMTELSLCEKCAKERGFFDPKSLAMAEEYFPDAVKRKVEELAREIAEKLKSHEDILSLESSSKRLTRPNTERVCPHCAFKLETLHATGRVGCPDCYVYFRHELALIAKDLNFSEEVIDDIAKSEEPASPPRAAEVPVVQRRKILQTQMKKAILRENYERAALLRDELKKLESES